MRRDAVTPALRADVMARDEFMCVAPRVCSCVASWAAGCSGRLTLDHVKEQPMIGKRAPSDMAHLATLCWHHHIESGWATAHRPELRDYLRRVSSGHVLASAD